MARMVVRVRGPVKRELRKLRQKTTDKGLATRCQIVLLWGEDQPWYDIAKGVGCSLSWVGRVTRRFRDQGIVAGKPRSGVRLRKQWKALRLRLQSHCFEPRARWAEWQLGLTPSLSRVPRRGGL